MLELHISHNPGSSVVKYGEDYWHLEIPASSNRTYNLAQLDDPHASTRIGYPWKPPLTLSLQARISAEDIPGTWGFGFWNDPFSFLLAGDRRVRRLPSLPNAVWFFHASPENYLSFRDDLPACGFHAATFSSKKVQPMWLALASPALGLTLLPQTAGIVRRQLRKYVKQDALQLDTAVTAWHAYSFSWEPSSTSFSVDGAELWRTQVSPAVPLGLVIWIDNQYAALPPGGRLKFGSLANPSPAWLEVREIKIEAR